MKLTRTRPFAVALALAAAAVVFGADTSPKKKPAPSPAKPSAPAKPAAATKPAEPTAPAATPAPPADAPASAAPAAPEVKAAVKYDANEVLATVDGEEIKRGEVEKEIGDVLRQQGMPPEALPPAQRDEATRQVLDNLVMEHIIKKATVGITVADADIDAEITKIKESNKIGDAEVAAKLKEAGKTIEDLKKDIRLGLTQRKWFEQQTKGKVADATEAEAKEFYDQNTKDFEQPEMLRASHILFTLTADAPQEKVAEAEKKANAAAARAQKGEDFAKLAAELTEEPGGKERGGDLDFFSRQQMVPEFSDAAFKLKTGEVTKAPVRSKFGFHIIKATDHKDASKQAFKDVQKDITEFLTKDKRQKAVNDVLAALKAKAKVDIKLPPPPPAPAPGLGGNGDIPPEILEQLQKLQEGKGAKPAAPAPPVEAVTPPVSAPPATPKK